MSVKLEEEVVQGEGVAPTRPREGLDLMLRVAIADADSAKGEGVKEGDTVTRTEKVEGGFLVRDPVFVPVVIGVRVMATTLGVAVRDGVVDAVRCIEGEGRTLCVRLPFPGLAV